MSLIHFFGGRPHIYRYHNLGIFLNFEWPRWRVWFDVPQKSSRLSIWAFYTLLGLPDEFPILGSAHHQIRPYLKPGKWKETKIPPVENTFLAHKYAFGSPSSAELYLVAVTLAKCNFGSMDRFRLQTRPLRSFWGPSRLFQRRNFSFEPSSFTQNKNPKLRWKGESRRFHPISVRLAKISVFESQTDRFFVLKWFIFAVTEHRRPKYQRVTKETDHF